MLLKAKVSGVFQSRFSASKYKKLKSEIRENKSGISFQDVAAYVHRKNDEYTKL